MTEAFIKGALAGLAYGLLLGPLFFLGLEVTLRKGIRNGLALAAGAFLSDLLLAGGSWWSSAQLLSLIKLDFFQSSLGLAGAVLIIMFGLSALWPRPEMPTEALVSGAFKRRYSLLKGFALNTANPSNWLFWLGLATAAQAEAPEGLSNYAPGFLAAALVMVLTTDIVKIVLAGKIGKRLRPGLPGKIVRISGFVLVSVGVWLLVKIIRDMV